MKILFIKTQNKAIFEHEVFRSFNALRVLITRINSVSLRLCV